MTSTERASVRVLLVDDDRDMTDLSKELFELQGVDADAAGTVSEALQAVDKNHYDAVVTDLSLETSGDGLGLTKRLCAEYPSLIVIVLSGDPTAERRALDFGARAFFRKPADLSVIAEFIRSAVQCSRAPNHP